MVSLGLAGSLLRKKRKVGCPLGWVVVSKTTPWHPWGLAAPSSAPPTVVLKGAEDAEGILL